MPNFGFCCGSNIDAIPDEDNSFLFGGSKIYDSDWSIFTDNPRPKGF